MKRLNRRAVAAVALAVLVVAVALITWWPRPGPIVANTTLDGFPLAVAADPDTGRFFVTAMSAETGGIRLMTLDSRTGKEVRAISLSAAIANGNMAIPSSTGLIPGTSYPPDVPLVDSRHGRVIVAVPGLAPDYDAAPNDTLGGVSIVDARSGRVAHTILQGANPVEIAVNEATGYLFVANSANSANAISADAANAIDVVDVVSGHVLSTIKLDQQPVLMSLDTRAWRLFVVTAKEPTPGNQTDQQLVAIDLPSGHILYRLPLHVPSGASVDSLVLDPARGRAVVSSLDPSSGRVLAIVDTRRGVVTRRVAVGIAATFLLEPRTGHIFVVGSTGGALPRTVRLLNPETGRLSSVFTAPEDLDGWLVDTGNGRVLCGGKTHIYLLDARTGARVATIDAHGMVGAIDGRTGHVIVLTPGPNSPAGQGEAPVLDGHGMVTVLDGRSGAILHRVTFGYMPLGAAVDERSGHIAVLDYGATIRAIDPWAWLPGGLRKRLPFIPPPGPATRKVAPSVGIIDPAR